MITKTCPWPGDISSLARGGVGGGEWKQIGDYRVTGAMVKALQVREVLEVSYKPTSSWILWASRHLEEEEEWTRGENRLVSPALHRLHSRCSGLISKNPISTPIHLPQVSSSHSPILLILLSSSHQNQTLILLFNCPLIYYFFSAKIKAWRRKLNYRSGADTFFLSIIWKSQSVSHSVVSDSLRPHEL